MFLTWLTSHEARKEKSSAVWSTCVRNHNMNSLKTTPIALRMESERRSYHPMRKLGSTPKDFVLAFQIASEHCSAVVEKSSALFCFVRGLTGSMVGLAKQFVVEMKISVHTVVIVASVVLPVVSSTVRVMHTLFRSFIKQNNTILFVVIIVI